MLDRREQLRAGDDQGGSPAVVNFHKTFCFLASVGVTHDQEDAKQSIVHASPTYVSAVYRCCQG